MAISNSYRDAYVVASLLSTDYTPYLNDKLFIEDGIVLNANRDIIGAVSNYVEDVLHIGPTLEQLRKDGVITRTSVNPLFLNENNISEFNIESGVVCVCLGEYVVIYCGVVSVDESEIVKAVDVYDDLLSNDDDEYYTLTGEGLKYLDSVLRDLTDELCESRIGEKPCVDEREDSKVMDNLFGNLGFGKLKDNRFKLSMNGIAVYQPTGKYVVYNKDNNEFVDATNLLFDIKDAMFLLPTVEVNVGDTVIHENKPYFIVDTTNEIKAVSYEDCTQTVLIPKSTMFGIKYFTKVFNMFGDNFAATGDLFSNPMMLMALMEGKNSDLTQMMLFSSLSNGDLGSNPMALAMLLKSDKNDDSLSTIAMMSMFNNGTNPFAPKKAKETKSNNQNRN